MRDLGRGRGREEEGGFQSNMQEITREFSASSVPSLSLPRAAVFFQDQIRDCLFSVKCQDFFNFFWRGFDLPLFVLVVCVWRNFFIYLYVNIMV